MAGRKIRVTGKGKREDTAGTISIVDAGPDDAGEPAIVDSGEAGEAGDQHLGEAGSDAEPVIDPAELEPSTGGEAGGKAGGETKGRRGRKPGTKNKQKSILAAASNLESVLFSLHLMGATLLQTPELAITKEESEMLTTAIQKVNEHYGVTFLSAKHAALVELVAAADTIYGPRAIAVSHRWKMEKMQVTMHAQQQQENREQPGTPQPVM